MRALFSLVGLLVVVAIVMLLARKQLQAVVPAAAPSASGAVPTVQEQARGVQQKVLQDVNRALEQGAARTGDSQP
ncbi:MAG: hypothetical protein KIT60_21505 [Burkholderiaceae bacterium]|nr:hypothetical protein [Burkholderiaceae bacterium]